MRRVQATVRVIIASLVLAVAHGAASDEAWAAGSRTAPPPGSSVPRVAGVALNPASVPGGATVNGTVTLLEPVPANGAVVNVRTSDSKAAAVPESVMVPAGASSGAFVVRTSRPPQQTTVDISARIGNSQPATARLVVKPSPTQSGYDQQQQKR